MLPVKSDNSMSAYLAKVIYVQCSAWRFCHVKTGNQRINIQSALLRSQFPMPSKVEAFLTLQTAERSTASKLAQAL